MTSNLVKLNAVNLTLGDNSTFVHVLKNISLEIETGETIALIGPSGSGKSTLLMVLAGLEKIDTGEVFIANQALHKLNEDQTANFRGKNIGIVFQSFHLIPNMTALENCAVPLELAGNKDAFAIAKKELEAVGLAHRLNHYPSGLSGGEQQRVAIARALAPKPHILLADEPTGNLDTVTGENIIQLIFARAKERNLTTILVTHDLNLASRCSRQMHMQNGIIEDGIVTKSNNHNQCENDNRNKSL